MMNVCFPTRPVTAESSVINESDVPARPDTHRSPGRGNLSNIQPEGLGGYSPGRRREGGSRGRAQDAGWPGKARLRVLVIMALMMNRPKTRRLL